MNYQILEVKKENSNKEKSEKFANSHTEVLVESLALGLKIK